MVINNLARRDLWERKGIQATVVPNVFDFSGMAIGVDGVAAWKPDDYNRDFRARIGLEENDLFILQATRIVARKGIELAVDFVRALDSPKRRAQLKERGLYDGRPFDDDSRIVLVLAGDTRDDVAGRYTHHLEQKIHRTGIDALFIENLVAGRRGTQEGQKTYSLWDTYVFADLVTYPSLWEGWGNQFLEAIRARLPIVMFEYPVFRADIKDKGFRIVSLGSEITDRDISGLVQAPRSTIEAAADQAVDLLTDAHLRRETMEHNFRTGKRHYSLESLQTILAPLFNH